MKYVVFIVVIALLSGCGEAENSNQITLDEIDLTGTWVMVNEIQIYNAGTGEYLSSDFVRFKYVLEETNIGVKYERCWEYGGYSPYGIKTENHFYMNPAENGFSLQEDGSLVRTTEYEVAYQPDFNFISIATLRKVSDLVEIDNGTFVINGPISVAEYDHVCTWQVSSNIGDRSTIEINVPYDDSYISLHFRMYETVIPGTYQYTNYIDATPISLDVISNADAFWTQINSNTLSPTNVSITIIESNNTTMSGMYSFTGQDNENYSGEFEIIF